jgi:PAS domain S-box-containing protein
MSEKPTYEELEQRVLEFEKADLKRKKNEDSLQRVVERANAILESISDAIFSLDDDLGVTFFNKAAERLLGRKSHEVLGRYLFDVFPEARGSIFDDKYHQAVKEKKPLHFETFFDLDPYRNWYDVRVYPQPEGISVYFQVITERKQALEEIQNLAKFPSENPNPVLRLGEDGLLLYANEASNVLIRDWQCNIGGQAPAFWSDLINAAIKDQSNRIVDVHLGDQIYSFDIAPIPNTNYANIYGRNDTARKQAEEALQKSEVRLRSMFEGHGAIMLLIEPVSGQIVDANRAAQNFYGYSLQTLKEMAIQDINVLMPEEVAQHREEAVRKQQNIFDFPHRVANGEIRTVEVYSSPIAIGGRQLLFSIIHDITERKRAEQSLADSERRLADIIDFLPDPTWVVDIEGRVIAWNRAMERITGIDKNEIIGKGDQAYAIPFYGAPRPLLIDLVLNRDVQLEEENPTLREENGLLIQNVSFHPSMGEGGLYFAATASRLYNAQGDVVGAIESIRDITDAKHMEQGREHLITELQDAISKVRTLSGLLPICASCKKIRDDKGYWNQIESYISKNSNAEFSHGICPECAKRLYPDFYKKDFNSIKR